MLRAFTTASAGTDLNTMYDSGMYGITGGTLSNYPTGADKYATILTVAYRKPSGNTKSDYAWQMGNFTQNTNRMWYRTSTANSWNAWRQIVNIASNTAVGNESTPVYVNANGEVTAGNVIGQSAYHDDSYFAASSHTHGNIKNGGTLQTSDVTIGSGDKLVITDNSDGDKVARASLSFGTSTTTFLNNKGEWGSPADTKVT